ncbi:MAG: ABC transporter substrate-binding protein, partial [Nitrospirae bacterium]|nr:ABC transporter substrate-binding protein [Nitrospirota bacterium]
ALAVRARNANAQAVMICGHLEETLSMRSALKKIKWSPRAFYSPVGPGLPSFFEKLGPDAEYIFSSSQWEVIGGMNPPGGREFYDHFMKVYHKKPSHFAATAYAAGQILEAAAQESQSLDRERLRDIFSKLDMLTVSGRYGVDRTGLQIKRFTVVTQVLKGKTEVVWPKHQQTARPVFR